MSLYEQFHQTGIPRPLLRSKGTLMALSVVAINAAGGVFVTMTSDSPIGPGMIGFALALLYLTVLRWRFFAKTWRALDAVIDWGKVRAALENHSGQ